MGMSPRFKRVRAVANLTAVAGFMAIHVLQSPTRAVLGATIAGTRSSAQTAPSTASAAPADRGAESYAKRCAICHGEQREGILPAFPPLASIKRQMTDQQITVLIHDGKGRMPGFQKMPDEELSGLLDYLATPPAKTPLPANTTRPNRKGLELSGEAAAGDALFQQNCSFCHGRDAMGGETGPDLTESKLVLTDTDGSKISEVVSQGRLNNEKKMPAFQFSKPELSSLVAFIRAREAAAAAMQGGRRGVAVADLQTGNVESGKTYFNGAGGCAKCHSPSGDLAGIARRFEGLQLEERMLYPRGAKSTVTVVLPSGQKVTGILDYLDEFTVALRDGNGIYKSWPLERVKYTVDSPVNAHVEQFSKYTDDDVHNLMAYLQTLR
jgi:mono/diheme cytochrome c family protein